MVTIVDRLTVHKQIGLLRRYMDFQLAVLRVCRADAQHEKRGKERYDPHPESSYLHFLWPSSGLRCKTILTRAHSRLCTIIRSSTSPCLAQLFSITSRTPGILATF